MSRSKLASALPIFLIVVVGLASIPLTFAFSLGDRGPSARCSIRKRLPCPSRPYR